MRLEVRLNHAGMAELLRSQDVRRMLREKAEAVAATAQSIAQADAYVTGAYYNSIHVEEDTTDRARTRVVADVDYAVIVEANDAVLSRALDAAG